MFFHFLPGHHTISFLGYKCLWRGKIYCCSCCSVYPSQSQLQIFPKVINVFFRWISRMYFEVVKKFKFILPFACICSFKDLNWRQMWLKQKGGTLNKSWAKVTPTYNFLTCLWSLSEQSLLQRNEFPFLIYMYIEKEKIATDAIYATVLKYITDKKQSKGA